MRVTSTRIIDRRRLRHMAVVFTLGVVSASAAAAASRLHDSDLDLAAAAAEKAQFLLVEQVVCGNPGEKSTEACDKQVKKAVELLARVREAIAAAATAADGGNSTPAPRN